MAAELNAETHVKRTLSVRKLKNGTWDCHCKIGASIVLYRVPRLCVFSNTSKGKSRIFRNEKSSALFQKINLPYKLQ